MHLTTTKLLLAVLSLGLFASGCVRVTVDPIQVDVRVQLVEDDLDNFFDDLDRKSTTLK